MRKCERLTEATTTTTSCKSCPQCERAQESAQFIYEFVLLRQTDAEEGERGRRRGGGTKGSRVRCKLLVASMSTSAAVAIGSHVQRRVVAHVKVVWLSLSLGKCINNVAAKAAALLPPLLLLLQAASSTGPGRALFPLLSQCLLLCLLLLSRSGFFCFVGSFCCCISSTASSSASSTVSCCRLILSEGYCERLFSRGSFSVPLPLRPFHVLPLLLFFCLYISSTISY